MHAPSEHHWGAIKLLLHYLNGTRSLGIRLLENTFLTLYGFSYADWAGNLDDRTSTSAFLIFLGGNPISWSSTNQRIVARSSTKAEYHAIVATVAELQWVKSLLSELLTLVKLPPTLFSDNIGATFLLTNLVFHSRIKYFTIDYHFVRDMVQSSKLRFAHVFASDQFVDALTKPLSQSCLFYICNKIDVISSTPS